MSDAVPVRDMQASRRTSGISKHRKILYTLACVLVALVVCEGAVRIRAWMRYGSTSAGVTDGMLVHNDRVELWVPRAGYELTSSRISIKINSLGFRGEEVQVSKPANTIRIACLGASTTFCSEVSSNRATWPHRLQELLQQKFPETNVEVINAGVPGYEVSSTLKNLEHRVLPLNPDLVIFYEANNEMASDTRALARSRGLLGAAEGYRSTLVTKLSKYSLLFDLGHKNAKMLFAHRDAPVGKLNGLPPNLTDHFVEDLARMQALVSDRGIPLVLSTFLVKYRRDQDRATQIKNADVAFYYMPWMSMDDLLDGIESYNQAIVRFARSDGIPVVAEQDSIPADAEHFADCMHLSDHGCDQMARRFFVFLDESGLVDKLLARTAEKPLINNHAIH